MNSYTPEQEKEFLLGEKKTFERQLERLHNARYQRPYSIYQTDEILNVIDERLEELSQEDN